MSKCKELLRKVGNMNEKVDIDKIINDLINTGWSKDNESQMRAVQLLKGIALSDEPKANAFMKKLDQFTSNMKANESLDEAESRNLIKQIHNHVEANKLATPKYSSATGAFAILSDYYRVELKVKDPDKRDDMIAKDTKLPSFEAVVKFMKVNAKKLNLKA